MDSISKKGLLDGQYFDPPYDLILELGACYLAIGKYDLARECFDKAANMMPSDPEPYVGLGEVSLRKELFQDAKLPFETALRFDEGCAEAYCGLGKAYQQLGNITKAFEMYQRCYKQNKDGARYLLGLFQVSCQLGKFSCVTEYMEDYLVRHPDDTSIMYCLITLYLRSELFCKARDMLTDYLVLEPSNENATTIFRELEQRASIKAGSRN